MPSLDTNVLIRYLVADDARQHRAAARVMESGSVDSPLFVPVTVCLELEWVLRTRYQIGKPGLIDVFVSLLETRGLFLQDEASIERALNLFADSAADFADCLHLALSISYGHEPFMTFDKRASRLLHAESV